VTAKLHHTQNVIGSDDSVINALNSVNYELRNPCHQMKIVHLHQSEVRTYDANQRIAKSLLYVQPKFYSKITNYSNLANFTFYVGKDVIGSDLYSKTNMPILDMMNVAQNDDNCTGFNTLGFFKTGPIAVDKLTTSRYYFTKFEGIYLKVKTLK